MFNEIHSQAHLISGILLDKQARAKASNEKRAIAEVRYKELAKAFTSLENKLSSTQEMLKEIPRVLNDYKKARKHFIEKTISVNLEMVFNEGYEVNFSITPYRDKMKAVTELWSVNHLGERQLFVPSEQNGGLCRQVISASFGMAVAELLNCKILFMDEAFNGGDSDKLRKTQLILQAWIAKGGQIVLNEHNPTLYCDTPCFVYEIEKEGQGFEGCVVVKNILEQGSVIDGAEELAR